MNMFVNRIGYWANEKGFKHKSLAIKCGVSAQTFSNWVNNKTQPDLEQSYKLSKILNITIDDLVLKEKDV